MKKEEKDMFLLNTVNVRKAARMYPKGSLDNHITAFNALCRMWDQNKEAREQLTDLGLDFSHRKFHPDQC